MDSNEDLQDDIGALQAKNQKLEKQIGELNKRIITTESELDNSNMRLIEAESRLQVETKLLEETKNHLVKVTVKVKKLEREQEVKREEVNDEKEEFQVQINSLKRQTEKDKQTRAELVAGIERFREEIGFKEDKEGKQMIIIEKLVQKLFSLIESAKMSECEHILTRLKDLENDKHNTDKEELWTWLEKELQNAGVWKDSQKNSSEPDQRLQESEMTEKEHDTLREEDSKIADETKLSEDTDQQSVDPEQNSSILEQEVEHIPQNNQLLDNGSNNEPEKPPLLASIDIGTCFCTYGFTKAKSDEKESIDDTSSEVEMKKVPTTALIEPTGDTLRAFGYDAEQEYKTLVLQGKHKDFYYFLRFKMALGKENQDIRGPRNLVYGIMGLTPTRFVQMKDQV